MDRRIPRGSPLSAPYAENETEIEGEMESMARWSIPRPSLSAGGGGGSGGSSISSGGPALAGNRPGSSSNRSTQSASSGSLLLSAASLANVSEHHTPIRLCSTLSNNYQANLSSYVTSVGSASLYGQDKESQFGTSMEPDDRINLQNHSDPFWNHVKLASSENQRRDLKDAESVASSTHFTVINGFTRHGRSLKNEKQIWCCKKTHQITVLVVTMTVLFTAGILAAICYIEMRQRRDTGSRFS